MAKSGRPPDVLFPNKEEIKQGKVESGYRYVDGFARDVPGGRKVCLLEAWEAAPLIFDIPGALLCSLGQDFRFPGKPGRPPDEYSETREHKPKIHSKSSKRPCQSRLGKTSRRSQSWRSLLRNWKRRKKLPMQYLIQLSRTLILTLVNFRERKDSATKIPGV